MYNPKVLVIGKNSFVASNLHKKVEESNFYFDWFSRGNESRFGNVIFGQTDSISNNSFFLDRYDVLVNFAILKNESIQENLDFLDSLLEIAKKAGVKKFIHFSSMMVYPYDCQYIDENSIIESITFSFLLSSTESVTDFTISI